MVVGALQSDDHVLLLPVVTHARHQAATSDRLALEGGKIDDTSIFDVH